MHLQAELVETYLNWSDRAWEGLVVAYLRERVTSDSSITAEKMDWASLGGQVRQRSDRRARRCSCHIWTGKEHLSPCEKATHATPVDDSQWGTHFIEILAVCPVVGLCIMQEGRLQKSGMHLYHLPSNTLHKLTILLVDPRKRATAAEKTIPIIHSSLAVLHEPYLASSKPKFCSKNIRWLRTKAALARTRYKSCGAKAEGAWHTCENKDASKRDSEQEFLNWILPLKFWRPDSWSWAQWCPQMMTATGRSIPLNQLRPEACTRQADWSDSADP